MEMEGDLRWLKRWFQSAPAFLIESPKLGFLNLMGDSGLSMLEADEAAIGPLFSTVLHGSKDPPECNVLVCYCDIAPGGQLRSRDGDLRDLIRDSGSWIVVVASENPSERYIESAGKKGYGETNLVMTLKRRGHHFPAFMARLFGRMKEGQTMSSAWVALAPQIPGASHETPELVFAEELGEVGFS